MKYLRLPAMMGLGLMGWMQAGMADDYSYLFDPSTMQVGQTVGEYLVVKDKCPTDKPCADTEKLKYVTAEAGRTGRLEIPVSAGSDFEIGFNIYNSTGWGNNLTITLYLSDDNSLPLNFNDNPHGIARLGFPGGEVNLNWKVGVNDFRLISEQGTLKISANDTVANLGDVKLILSGTITRIVISKIDDTEQDYLFEIRTRGIQKGGTQGGGDFETGKQTGIQQCQKDPASCGITTTNGTTGGTHATFNPCTRELYIPLVDVPGEFGVMQTYEVYLVQQPSTLTFGLDMNRLKVVQ